MKRPRHFQLNDVVRLKKKHPCGEDRWEILRTGMDFRIRCLGCGRLVLLPRRKFEKAVKEVLTTYMEGEKQPGS